jgi:hypothetical protein
MSEFARYLIAAGVTHSRFSRIARQALFRAASQNARFRNSRLNQSAVAAMTGLTRAQVRQLAQTDAPAVAQRPDYIERIIDGWNADPAFTTSSYIPRRLSTTGRHATFGHLVRKYGGDIPTRSILREMVRNELVTIKGKYIQLAYRARQTKSQARLQQLSQILSRLLKSSEVSSDYSSLRPTIMEVTYPSSSSKGRTLLQRKSAEGLRAFLSKLQASGIAASLETPASRRHKTLVTRTRILVMTDELDRRDLSSHDPESKRGP